MQAFLGDSLDAAARHEIEQHLDSCPECLELMTLAAQGSVAGSIDTGDATDYRELAAVDPSHYVIGREIARGGMGRIMIAHDRRLGRDVAIKLLLVDSPLLRRRLEREVRISARLQHPAIVSVHEAGTWPTGEIFYAMKLVTGESLDKAIARSSSRLALLPNVIAAVDALAYAHSKRVIHRDLKPANVLVGEFGETVVIDWGLAKSLDEADVSIGSVVGTPMYMPPEQARGESVDERADVYSLGAMLYQLLSGTPPYTGATPDDVRAAVVAGPPAALPASVPRDLVAIVEKAMARDPAARYPTAKQLAEDLKKFQTGQLVGAHRYSTGELVRRWIRRHRTTVALGAIAIFALGVVAVVSMRRIVREQERADRQRVAAERSRHDAEDLLSFMVGDVSAKARPLGKLDLLEDVAKKATAYYANRRDDVSVVELGTRGRARTNLGEVLFEQGHTAEALAEFRAALAIADRLAIQEPANAAWRRDQFINRVSIGDAVIAQGDRAAALVEYRAALAIGETVVATTRANNDRRQLSNAHERIGDVLLAQGDLVGAMAAHERARAIDIELTRAEPDNREYQRGLVVALNKVGNVLLERGDATGALARYRESLAIAERLVARHPRDADSQRDVAVGHDQIGNIFALQGDTKQALAEFRIALSIADDMAAKDPTSAQRRRDLWMARTKIGDVLFDRGELDAALAEYRSAGALADALVANDPTSAAALEYLRDSHMNLGDVQRERHDAKAALAEYHAGLQIAEKLAARDTTNELYEMEVGSLHTQIGELLLERDEQARAEFQAAMAIYQKLAATDPTNAIKQKGLATGHRGLGDALRASGDPTGALAEYRAMLAIAEQQTARNPSSEWPMLLAGAHARIGDALVATRDIAGARAAYAKAREIAQPIANRDPANAEVRRFLEQLGARRVARSR